MLRINEVVILKKKKVTWHVLPSFFFLVSFLSKKSKDVRGNEYMMSEFKKDHRSEAGRAVKVVFSSKKIHTPEKQSVP